MSLPAITLLSCGTLGKQNQVIAVRMFQEFKNAAGVQPLCSQHAATHSPNNSSGIFSSPRGAQNHNGFDRHPLL